MSIDFESKEGRETYLNEKLDNLLSGMDSVYGQVLLEELITRLQRTLEDFNEEIDGIVGGLKDSSERRNQIIHDLMEGNESVPNEDAGDDQMSSDTSELDTSEMSEWERRLEEAGKLGDSGSSDTKPKDPVKEETPKKKGLFGRKKK